MAGVLIGLDNLCYAILTKDEKTGAEYQVPVKIEGAVDAKIAVKSNTATLFADDGPMETATSIGSIEVELQTADLDLQTQAALLGHKIQNGVLVKSLGDIPPYVAIGFRSKKTNEKYRYVWLLKGKFTIPDEEYATVADKVKFQNPKIKGTFVKRNFDGNWQVVGDDDTTGFTVDTASSWFTKVVDGSKTTTI